MTQEEKARAFDFLASNITRLVLTSAYCGSTKRKTIEKITISPGLPPCDPESFIKEIRKLVK